MQNLCMCPYFTWCKVLRSTHIVKCDRVSAFYSWLLFSCRCTYSTFCLSIHLLALMNKAAMNMGVRIQILLSIQGLAIYPAVRLLDHMVIFFFQFFEELIVFHARCTIFMFPPAVPQGSKFSASLLTLVLSCSLIAAILLGARSSNIFKSQLFIGYRQTQNFKKPQYSPSKTYAIPPLSRGHWSFCTPRITTIAKKVLSPESWQWTHSAGMCNGRPPTQVAGPAACGYW